MKATIKIHFEEGNSVPQLSHLWHAIVRHRYVQGTEINSCRSWLRHETSLGFP